jgi:Putative transmembrane protein (PGPGW)
MHKKVAITVLGWVLVCGGIAALVLPGPGLLLLLAGLVVLASEYAWAERKVEPLRRRAFEAAEFSVSAWWRIAITALGGLWLVGLGVVWALDPRIPEFWVFGPRLPAAGMGTAVSLVVSGLLVWGLMIYSIKRFRGRRRR